MSELDFDELDKAVNTLMGDVPRAEPAKTDDIKTLNISSTLSDTSRPSLAELNSALTQVNGAPSVTTPAAPVTSPPAAASPIRTSTPPLATRRGGRFMDVVHPSSDMKGATKPFLSNARQGVTIEPTGPVIVDAIETPVAPVFAPVAATETPDTPAALPVTSDQAPSVTDHEWPDPLDMPNYETESTAPTDVATLDELVTSTPDDAPAHVDESDDDDDALFTLDGDEEIEAEEPQPLNSPFLADAKVEKRPLGGTYADEPTEELGHAPVLGLLVDETADETHADDQLPASPDEVDAPLPPELQSDLMAIETDGDSVATSQETPDATPVLSDSTPIAVATPVAEAAVSTGPTSIPQQYKEEQSTGDQPSGSIYDTDSYHQPLAHPAKTKSGWLWIIWILLLLIVGGGGAVALYFLGII